ncbi:MAG: 1-acyl-sn-glycerol-3-phosphate acyltransferase [Chitinophagaceae bacterium]|nr:1-acyl-sn-glycerol-3-phosphate acyltransferase [Chitinophagaceae bacterium]
MFYKLLKLPARLAFYFYCRKLITNNREIFKSGGPLLIAANHPNSFLDAILLATLFKQPVHSLTRGDVFANPFYSKILHRLNMLPVYRISEGAANLGYNYNTFNECLEVFKKNGIVLIFSEGRCINEWHLRALKKGTARLAMSAWQQGIPLKIIPLGINYSSFRIFGKNIVLNWGDLIYQKDIGEDIYTGRAINLFNEIVQAQLKKLVIEINGADKKEIEKTFYIYQSAAKKIILFIPSILGWLLHFPLYKTVEFFIRKRANDHYDSIMVGLLFFLYPVYLLIITIAVYLFTKNLSALLLILVIPFTAWSLLQLKRQVK